MTWLNPFEPVGPPPFATKDNSAQNAFSDYFDGTNGSYDTNLWTCENDCNFDDVFLTNGVLSLQRHKEGWTSIKSISEWAYKDVASLTGNFLINDNLNQEEVGWLGFLGNALGCGFWGTTEPYVQCAVGPTDENGNRDYNTDNIVIQSNTWHSIKYEFDQSSNIVKFYLDGGQIGENPLTVMPNTLQIALGIFSPSNNSNGHMYIDNVELTLNK